MPRSRRGGYQQPANPAPVSGPGRLARRTDQGQPVRLPTGQPYGARAALQAQQQAAPMAAAPPPGPALAPAPAPAGPLPSVFRPTDRPNEPITAGIPIGAGSNGPAPAYPDPNSEDPALVLQALFRVFPDATIARLLDEVTNRSAREARQANRAGPSGMARRRG